MDQETLEKAELYAEYQSLLMEEKALEGKDKKEKALEGKDKKEEELPKSFICPITNEVMRDPVMDEDGNSYERTAILGRS